MSFIIRYNKTGKEIEISNKTGYIIMRAAQLDELGFKASDVFEED